MKTIGVIDDDEDCGFYLKALLEGELNVSYYSTWKEAEPAFTKFPPDLILLDISMPEIKGEEVLKRLKSIPTLAGVPVVALTAFALTGDRERFIELGFDGYLAKPLTEVNELLQFFNENTKKVNVGREL